MQLCGFLLKIIFSTVCEMQFESPKSVPKSQKQIEMHRMCKMKMKTLRNIFFTYFHWLYLFVWKCRPQYIVGIKVRSNRKWYMKFTFFNFGTQFSVMSWPNDVRVKATPEYCRETSTNHTLCTFSSFRRFLCKYKPSQNLHTRFIIQLNSPEFTFFHYL